MYTPLGTLDRDATIRQYAPMVRRVASQLIARLPANVDIDDLIQAGMIGLLDASTRYDSSQGAQFETFAMQRVRGAMLDELRASDWMPRSVRRNQRRIETAIHDLEQRLQRAPTESEIAAHLKLGLEQYQQLLIDSKGAQLMYIDDIGPEGGEEGYLERNVPDTGPLPLERIGDARFRKALADAIARLPEREKLVMGLYYQEGLNLKEIGAVLGVTESRISQMHSQSVARLRSQLRDWV
ncbi:MAG: RNA polymerase sigma factor FliA [Lautropia sp.]